MNFKTLFKIYPRVHAFLLSIVEELRDFFTPKNQKEWQEFERRLAIWDRQQLERNRVRALQKEYNLPLKVNETERQCMVRIRLKRLKEKKKREE